jgi:hypothetical protein
MHEHSFCGPIGVMLLLIVAPQFERGKRRFG